MKRGLIWKYTVIMLILVFLIGILVGCDGREKVISDAQKEMNKEKKQSLEFDASLLNLRQSMDKPSELFAVAYLGYVQDFYNESTKGKYLSSISQ